MTGGFNPSPSYGGDSSNSVNEIFLNSLNAADGNALNHDVDSYNYAENFAAARALADLFSTNVKMKNQFNTNKMTDFISRWEKIMKLVPDTNSSDNTRRQLIGNKLYNYGKSPTPQVINDLLKIILGPVFVKIINFGWDINSNTYIGLSSINNGLNLTSINGVNMFNNDWSSSFAYILILVQQPDYMLDAQFYNIVKLIDGALEDLLSSWTTFAWGRYNSLGQLGFLLDDPHNLDNSILT
jgi:hypothetical protein